MMTQSRKIPDFGETLTSCVCISCCLLPFSLALITGIIFFDFYIGWSVQWNYFNSTGNALAEGYGQLFVSPSVSDPWSIFSCFLYGFLIVKACMIPFGVLICICCGCCVGCCSVCLGRKDVEPLMDFSNVHIPNYNSFTKASVYHNY